MNPLAGMDMSRILLDLSNEVIKQLDDLPRADLLREAVDQYLVNQSQTARTSVPGIWQGCEEDGVEYLRKLREKW
ncbi:putative CopG-family DNA-binding protein [Klebsiella pneumoniae]|nr:putative CopG-family DNA-binding protein [Klebsiella pneumoniae]